MLFGNSFRAINIGGVEMVFDGIYDGVIRVCMYSLKFKVIGLNIVELYSFYVWIGELIMF